MAQAYSEGTRFVGKDEKVKVKIEVEKGRYVYLMAIDGSRVERLLNAISESTFRAIVKEFTAHITVRIVAEKVYSTKEGDKGNGNNHSK